MSEPLSEPSVLAQLILARDAAFAEAAGVLNERHSMPSERREHPNRVLVTELVDGLKNESWARQGSGRS
jgi:hypothetical protein